MLDAVVIGAGFGGLGAAVELARRGAKVALVEALTYPGGCASTFRRGGYSFEAGATLFSGLGPHQLFGTWKRELELPVTFDWLDPVVEVRAEARSFGVCLDRDRFVEMLAALPRAPREGVRAFFAEQRRVADRLWRLLDDPALLPPFDGRALLRHAARIPEYLPLLALIGTPLGARIEHHGLDRFEPVRGFLDSLCQITVQCSAKEAEAPFAFGAIDYFWHGTGHVRGGIGALARALAEAVGKLGGEVSFANAARRIERTSDGFVVHARKGPLRARTVLANLLPGALASLLPAGADPGLARLGRAVDDGWGAAMLYRVVRTPEGFGASACHLDLVLDAAQPLIEGNHVFVSVSGEADEGRAPPGMRTLTVSTHVPLAKLREVPPGEVGAYVGGIHERMRTTLQRRAPELCEDVVHEETASPRTFERFTRRPGGAVGGIPRRAGLANYRTIGPFEVERGLYLIGDSVFPGQSTLATALGGVRTAEAVRRAKR